MAETPQVLGEADLERIQSGLTQAEQALNIIEQAEQAGIDVSQQKERAKQSRDRLLRIKNTFFPGR